MNLGYEEIESLSTKCGIKTPFCPSEFLPKIIKYQIASTEIDKYFRDGHAHILKSLLSLTLTAESSWLLNNQQRFKFLKHKIDNTRYITVHRGSIIVLYHFVHRAFGLDAPIKHDDRRHHLNNMISYTIMAQFKYDIAGHHLKYGESMINASFKRGEREREVLITFSVNVGLYFRTVHI